MKRYEVVVNDEVFEVSLRELKADETIEVTPQTSAAKTNDTPVASTTSNQEGVVVSAPMSGVIMKILVKEGQSVKAGDNLFILEAMKMENEIKATQDGVIKSILVTESQQVETKQELAVM
ncbi:MULTISPECIES: biotin/lipoyl-containing protein [Globicatella]|uniref:biotin/lipoyl-containing protein n=1 Tax=Globicatella TaxID=13075 RepID=UPI000825577B|nr:MULTISPECIES: biotin/lipoyl-containing protein [Globicatella]MDK7630073.1 biotin/lipoyl-containing protein [Globicatella sanguinis]OFK60235.1 hypothetical protein HMPREF2811_03810 [Globicatella sp. HMSC072A10]WIK65571.1 biotin/lipoyl-containing protein [Globicatella sanguinis]WKT54976.1 biotin/lipoyl-containing protein [Globicatella sanguinis]